MSNTSSNSGAGSTGKRGGRREGAGRYRQNFRLSSQGASLLHVLVARFNEQYSRAMGADEYLERLIQEDARRMLAEEGA